MAVDYSLYLVTDNTRAILGNNDLVSVVRDAVQGGVTVVQLRDKTSETADLIRTARALHRVTQDHGIPLIINDRADVAVAIGAEGLHIGQEDIDFKSARLIMGDNAIIGVTVNSREEALRAARDGADYLGIGTVYATSTKKDTKSIIGPSGVRDILHALAAENIDISTVCIGGINHQNVQRVLFQSSAPLKRLNGVAVVSAIIGADDPKVAAATLQRLIRNPPAFAISYERCNVTEVGTLVGNVNAILQCLVATKPLNHNMTNLVVQNFAANVALAIGSSPIMSSNGLEATDLAALRGSLVINMGSVAPESMANYIAGARAYNDMANPVVFDPVGCGATSVRREAAQRLLSECYFDVIKGNESEIRTLLGENDVVQHGVDSSSSASTFPKGDVARIARTLARREKNVVVITGEVDILSDGERTFAISNGHLLFSVVTGSGCALGTTIAACLAVEKGDKLNATLAALLLYEIAGERAAEEQVVKGPGSFVPAFIDALYCMRNSSSDEMWLRKAKVQFVEVEELIH